LPDPIESDSEPQGWEPFLSRCPFCQRTVLVRNLICSRCGFPFYWELHGEPPSPPVQRVPLFTRFALVTALFAFIIYFTVGTVTRQEGYTTVAVEKVIASGLIQPPMPVNGDVDFQKRTQLALSLLRQRAPSFYDRLVSVVNAIDYVPKGMPTKSWRSVAAFAEPEKGYVYVRIPAVYSSGFGELYDRDVFYYASVLIHEMRHLELARVGLNVGGLAEEVECEQTVYDALTRMDAPKPLLIELEQFLNNPNHPRYKQWLQFYKENPPGPTGK
jgi:hypothetical protein